MTMREKIARALYCDATMYPEEVWHHEGQRGRAPFLKIADIALAAVSTLTDEMVERGARGIDPHADWGGVHAKKAVEICSPAPATEWLRDLDERKDKARERARACLTETIRAANEE